MGRRACWDVAASCGKRMSAQLRIYLRAKAILLAMVLDDRWAENNNAVELAHMDFVNARDSGEQGMPIG